MKYYLDVAVNIPVNKTFMYSFNSDKEGESKAEIGKRVSIDIGGVLTTGAIVKVYDTPPSLFAVPISKIKEVKRVIDKEAIFGEELLKLAKWLSEYYLCAIGEALFTILPSYTRSPRIKESKVKDKSIEESEGENSREFPIELPIKKLPIDSTIKRLKLSEEQEEAISKINLSLKRKEHNYHYLFGVTGSGKTEVFLTVADRVLKEKKSVIYLVPEIALTPQVIKEVKQRFGSSVAVLHSSITPSSKFLEWQRIIRGEARIVVGVRSAIFAPVKDLGLIIIDEEHDSSYKSGETPRYHARQVAMKRASVLGIPLVMGSATPSVEAYYAMEKGTFITHRLTKRVAGGATPTIKCIDLNKVEEGTSCLSSELEAEIRATLQQKRQVILFLNRRGFTHYFRCNDCGYEIMCKNCSVPLTYHITENKLKCHYCGFEVSPPSICPSCASLNIGYIGFGTEYVEAKTKLTFPNARIVRIDRDVLKKDKDVEGRINAFRKGEYDIMLGTQMVAKGLNFPNLRLVGIILADTALHFPDFRAEERTFSLITQVAGRAGRYFPDGKVIVQSYAPYKKPIFCACNNTLEEFYHEELKIRRVQDFPPYSRLVRLVFRSTIQENAKREAENALQFFNDSFKTVFNSLEEGGKLKVSVVGMAECPILKVKRNYRYNLLLKSNNIGVLQRACKSFLYGTKHISGVYTECDIDPVSML